MSKSVILTCCLFLTILSWFVWNGKIYKADRLLIEGHASSLPTKIEVLWDSGSGFNRYERKLFKLGEILPAGKNEHEIFVRYTGERNGASLSNELICKAILVDGSPVALQAPVLTGAVSQDQGLRLRAPGDSLHFYIPGKKSIVVEMLMDNHSGIVEIELNGQRSRYDLYTANSDSDVLPVEYWILGNQAQFHLDMLLPRYPINRLEIRTVPGMPENRFTRLMVESKGQTVTPLDQSKGVPIQTLEMANKGSRTFFHPVRFGFQLFFAGITTWTILLLVQYVQACGSWRDIFLAKQRPVFWFFLGAALCWFFVFLLAFWPGIMSVDSMKIWRAAKLPGVFLNDHPVFNVVLYMYLMHLWDNAAIVPTMQVFFTALLGASIFFWFFRQGISLFWLVPLYLFFVLSLPVALYNLMLWKDIPFALLAVTLAWFMVLLYEQKQKGVRTLVRKQWIALTILTCSLALTRHNGLVYIFFVPMLLFILGFLNHRWVLRGGLLVVVFLGLAVGLMRITGYSSEQSFFVQKAREYVLPMVHGGSSDRLLTAAKEYPGILNINQTASKWDLFHFYLKDRFDYRFLTRSGWNDVFPYSHGYSKGTAPLRKMIMDWYERSYTKPFVFFIWNPLFLLVLYPVAVLLFPVLPRSALYSSFFLVQVVALLVVAQVLNWRYYYFLYLGGFFLVPMLLLDVQTRASRINKSIKHAF